MGSLCFQPFKSFQARYLFDTTKCFVEYRRQLCLFGFMIKFIQGLFVLEKLRYFFCVIVAMSRLSPKKSRLYSNFLWSAENAVKCLCSFLTDSPKLRKILLHGDSAKFLQYLVKETHLVG